jgi:hypothetical protein
MNNLILIIEFHVNNKSSNGENILFIEKIKIYVQNYRNSEIILLNVINSIRATEVKFAG